MTNHTLPGSHSIQGNILFVDLMNIGNTGSVHPLQWTYPLTAKEETSMSWPLSHGFLIATLSFDCSIKSAIY